MKKQLFFLLVGCIIGPPITAQIDIKDFKPFIGNQTIVDTLFNGPRQNPREVLLILSDNEQDDFQKMILLQNSKGKLKKTAENDELIMNLGMLGVMGNNYSTFSDNIINVAYTLGSNSASSDVSIQFEKNKEDGNYYFKAYYLTNYNFGVENLFTREVITNLQTGEIKFSEATEDLIFSKAKLNPFADNSQPFYKTTQRFAKYVPQDWNFANFSEGDLNLDKFKRDLLFLLYNEDTFKIQLLMEQKDGSYKITATNDRLIKIDDTFNINNFKAVIKNGYFTIEQRVASDDGIFDHRYITFKYDTKTKNWLFHRYDVEHFSGFDTKPSADVTHLTTQDFGTILFEDLDYTPGDYFLEPSYATISGTLVEKQFYGRPNYGETPETDEKVNVYILKPDYPVNALAPVDQSYWNTSYKNIRNITEIQTYTLKENLDLSLYLNKKITLGGTLIQAETGGHYTPVLLKVNAIINKNK